MAMETALASLGFVAAALAAGTMGFAIQRGGTCTVAAMEELVSERRVTRLLALGEAALWVAGGLLVAAALHRLPSMPSGYATTAGTVFGGALLGLGAFVNRACVFGAIARFGSGEWAYLLTPVGFFFGCLSVGTVFGRTAHAPADSSSPVLMAAATGALAFGAFALWRLARPLLGARRRPHDARAAVRLHRSLARQIWSPHAATSVIGVAFVLLFLLVGSWAYTDVLAEAAGGRAGDLPARACLLLALFAGAVVGGATAGRFRATRPEPAALARCLAGGVLMGWGSLLIPGGNDGLILMGMPLLWPYAWVAFATMCATVALALVASRFLARARARRERP